MGLVDRLPPYELGEIASLVRELKSSGADVFDLSQFNPRPILGDLSLEYLVKESLKIDNHRYSSSQGIKRLREAFCEMYKKRWGVVLCPDTEVCVTMGIKDGIENTIRAIFSPGDMVLLPAPSYPNHKAAILLAGANIEQVPLIDRNGSYNDLDNNQDSFNFFFEQIENIYEMNWPKPKGLLCSFPHNPSGITVDQKFFDKLAYFCRERGIILMHDFAYADFCTEGYTPPSALTANYFKSCGVEFYSLSKGFGLGGWRVGVAVGNRELISQLTRVKSYFDNGIFQPLQLATIKVLGSWKECQQINTLKIETGQNLCRESLSDLGWELKLPRSTPFVWARLPEALRRQGSISFSRDLLKKAHLAVYPGGAFDRAANEYLRIIINEPEHRVSHGLRKLKSFLKAE